MAKNSNYESPNFPIARPGASALQLRAEALEREHQHEEWHEAHPGEMCPPAMMKASANDYEDIARGDNLMGAMTFEAGDAFVSRSK